MRNITTNPAARPVLALWTAAMLLGCVDDRFQIDVRSGDASGGAQVALEAIDEVEVVLAPNRVQGNTFPPQAPRISNGGGVETRVSAAGEWVLRLFPPYLADNAALTDEGFSLSIPLSMAGDQQADVDAPSARVTFIRRGERIAESALLRLPWPLRSGTSEPLFVPCRAFFAVECQTPR